MSQMSAEEFKKASDRIRENLNKSNTPGPLNPGHPVIRDMWSGGKKEEGTCLSMAGGE